MSKSALSRKASAASCLAYFKPTYLEHGENLCEEIAATGVDFADDPLDQFQYICDYYYQGLSDVLPSPQSFSLTSENARNVNAAQYDWLLSKNYSNNDHSVGRYVRELIEAIPEKEFDYLANCTERTIVPYFRLHTGANHGDVDPFGFGVSVYALRRLIQEQRTHLFTHLACVSRQAGKFPTYLTTLYGSALFDPCFKWRFLKRTAIASNIIHYAHGSADQLYLGSIPILGTSVRKDTYKMEEIGENHVPLRLSYDQDNGNCFTQNKLPEDDFARSIPGIMQETIRALVELEELMLRRTESQEVIREYP